MRVSSIGMFNNFASSFAESLARLPMSDNDKLVISARFIPLVSREQSNYRWNYIMYILLTNVVTLGGVLTVAFSSFNQLGTNENITYGFGWAVWGIGIAITLASKWMTQFNISKKYILGMASLEKLQTEGWSFLGGIGRYDTLDMSHRAKVFLTRVEKLRMKSMESMPEAESNSAFKDILAGGMTREATRDETPGDITHANMHPRTNIASASAVTTYDTSPLVSDDEVRIVVH